MAKDIKVLGANLFAVIIVPTLQEKVIIVDHRYDPKRLFITFHRNVPCM
jgi:hypothetical protein